MKKLILSACLMLLYTGCSHMPQQQQQQIPVIKDCFYLVEQLGKDSTDFGRLSPSQALVTLDRDFVKNDPQDFDKAVIDLSDYVPLELEKLPVTTQEKGSKKTLLISLTTAASEKIKSFTQARVRQEVAIMLNGKVLTVHKIREAITSGQVQVSRCDDSACVYLFTKLKDKVKQ